MNPDPACGEKQTIYFTGFPLGTNIVNSDPKSLIEPTYETSKDLASELSINALFVLFGFLYAGLGAREFSKATDTKRGLSKRDD